MDDSRAPTPSAPATSKPGNGKKSSAGGNGNGHGKKRVNIEANYTDIPVMENNTNTAAPEAKAAQSDVLDEHLSQMMGDAPFCSNCGHVTVRSGSCYKCLNCGNSMGCS